MGAKRPLVKSVWQLHHLVYGDTKNKEVTRRIRKGCHRIITLIRRFNFLTDQEINTICLECELKRKYNGKQKAEKV